MSLDDELQECDRAEADAIRALLGDEVDRIAASDAAKYQASAAKRGRNPRFPYVPILKITGQGGATRTEQLIGLAYATRDEAVARARRQIDANRRDLAQRLCVPRYRALREQHGLPRDPLNQQAASALHTCRELNGVKFCDHCRYEWPCPTISALGEARNQQVTEASISERDS